MAVRAWALTTEDFGVGLADDVGLIEAQRAESRAQRKQSEYDGELAEVLRRKHVSQEEPPDH